jgi:HEAT repeat protein
MRVLHIRLSVGIACFILFAVSAVATADSGLEKNSLIVIDQGRSLRQRTVAIYHLGASGDVRAVEPLLNILTGKTESEGLRSNAARALADLGEAESRVISTLETVYGEEGAGKNLRYTILLCFGRMGAAESLALLSKALSDSNPMIRFKACQALGQLGGGESVQLLGSHLRNEKDTTVRAEAVRALGDTKSMAAEEALVHSLLSDPKPIVRWNAALMLKQLPSLSPDAHSALNSALNDSSPVVSETVKGILQ